jgi:hypothetical protein
MHGVFEYVFSNIPPLRSGDSDDQGNNPEPENRFKLSEIVKEYRKEPKRRLPFISTFCTFEPGEVVLLLSALGEPKKP